MTEKQTEALLEQIARKWPDYERKASRDEWTAAMQDCELWAVIKAIQKDAEEFGTIPLPGSIQSKSRRWELDSLAFKALRNKRIYPDARTREEEQKRRDEQLRKWGLPAERTNQ